MSGTFKHVTVMGVLVTLSVVGCSDTTQPPVAQPPASQQSAGQPPTDRQDAGQPSRGQPLPVQPLPGQPLPGQPLPGQPPGPRHPGGHQPGEPPFATAGPGSPPSEAPPSEQPPSPAPPQVSWVPPGAGTKGPLPSDGDGPPQSTTAVRRWQQAFDKRDCSAIAALGPERGQPELYAGLGDACRAVIQHDDQLWPAAERASQQVNDPDNCLDRVALRLLRELVTAHQSSPHAEIQIVKPPPGRLCEPQHTRSPTPVSSHHDG